MRLPLEIPARDEHQVSGPHRQTPPRHRTLPPCHTPTPAYLCHMADTRILYNATCPVCSFEIDAYRRRAIREGLALQFDTLDHAADWGLTPDQAARRLHVIHLRRQGLSRSK